MRAAERPRPPQAAGGGRSAAYGRGEAAGPPRGQVAPPGAAGQAAAWEQRGRSGPARRALTGQRGPGLGPGIPQTQQEHESGASRFVCAVSTKIYHMHVKKGF